MKKALLAVAVLATFGSGSALAAFGTETEGTTPVNGNITMGGKFNPPASTWMAAIDEAPSELNNKVVDVSAWKGKSGAFTYEVSAKPTPLVYVRTKTSNPGVYPRPSISIAQSPGLLNNQAVTVKGIQVSMDAGSGVDFKPTTDVTLDVTFKGGWAVGMDTGHGMRVGLTAPKGGDGVDVAFTDLAKLKVADSGLDKVDWQPAPPASWDFAMKVLAGTAGFAAPKQAAAAAVAGLENATLISNRDVRPTGTWQATLPVEVTYI